jgi:Uma2 family endonuclease
MTAITLNFPPTARLSDEQFTQLCSANRDLQFERTSTGELIIMSPTGGETSRKNSEIIIELGLWNRQTQLGIVFDSSGGFKLPNGADRSPDASWIPLTKWNNLTPVEQEKFLPLCPDFVIELRSPTDVLKTLQEKMLEYIDNGTRLGWLINPQDKQVEIYRIGQDKQVLDNPATLSGENVLLGFILNLQAIW